MMSIVFTWILSKFKNLMLERVLFVVIAIFIIYLISSYMLLNKVNKAQADNIENLTKQVAKLSVIQQENLKVWFDKIAEIEKIQTIQVQLHKQNRQRLDKLHKQKVKNETLQDGSIAPVLRDTLRGLLKETDSNSTKAGESETDNSK